MGRHPPPSPDSPALTPSLLSEMEEIDLSESSHSSDSPYSSDSYTGERTGRTSNAHKRADEEWEMVPEAEASQIVGWKVQKYGSLVRGTGWVRCRAGGVWRAIEGAVNKR